MKIKDMTAVEFGQMIRDSYSALNLVEGSIVIIRSDEPPPDEMLTEIHNLIQLELGLRVNLIALPCAFALEAVGPEMLAAMGLQRKPQIHLATGGRGDN